MPDLLVDLRTKHVGIPSAPPRIKIPASHVRAAKAHAQRIIDEAITAWKRADVSSLKRFDGGFLKHNPEVAQRILDDVPDGTGTLRTLERCRQVLGYAAQTLGAVRYLIDDDFVTELDRRQSNLNRNISSLRKKIEYTGDDCDEFLVHVGHVEQYIQQATGLPGHNFPPENAMQARGAFESFEFARRDLDDGRRLYERYRSGLDDPKSFGGLLERNRESLETDAKRLKAQYEGDDARFDDPAYKRARVHTASRGWRDGRHDLVDAKGNEKDGFEILSAMKTADVLDSFLASKDAKRVFRAKKQATSELRKRLSNTDDSFTRHLLVAAHHFIKSGDYWVGTNEQPRVEGYACYLLGRASVKHAPKVAKRLTRR